MREDRAMDSEINMNNLDETSWCVRPPGQKKASVVGFRSKYVIAILRRSLHNIKLVFPTQTTS